MLMFPARTFKKLGEFIEVSKAKKLSYPRYPFIICLRLLIIGLGIVHHCPELDTAKNLSALTHPALYKEYTSAGVEHNEYAHNRHQPAEDTDNYNK